MVEKVFSLALELSGVAEGEASGLSLFCQMAVEELTGMLKQGVTVEACGETFAMAAAQVALADWWSLSGRPKKFTAGDVTVEEAQVDPAALRKQALSRLSGKIKAPGVALRGVRC